MMPPWRKTRRCWSSLSFRTEKEMVDISPLPPTHCNSQLKPSQSMEPSACCLGATSKLVTLLVMLSWGRKTQRQQEWHLLHSLGKGNNWREAGNIDGSFADSCCIQESTTSSVHRMLYKWMGLHQRMPCSQSRRYLLQKQSIKTVM